MTAPTPSQYRRLDHLMDVVPYSHHEYQHAAALVGRTDLTEQQAAECIALLEPLVPPPPPPRRTPRQYTRWGTLTTESARVVFAESMARLRAAQQPTDPA